MYGKYDYVNGTMKDIKADGTYAVQLGQYFDVLPSRGPVGTASKLLHVTTVRLRGMGTGISEASKRVPIFSFATQGGKQVSSHFRHGNWVQAREAQIRFPAG